MWESCLSLSGQRRIARQTLLASGWSWSGSWMTSNRINIVRKMALVYVRLQSCDHQEDRASVQIVNVPQRSKFIVEFNLSITSVGMVHRKRTFMSSVSFHLIGSGKFTIINSLIDIARKTMHLTVVELCPVGEWAVKRSIGMLLSRKWAIFIPISFLLMGS